MSLSALIVEDDPALGRVMRQTLASVGYAVQKVEPSYDRAMRALAAERPAVLVVDITLDGERDGLELAHDAIEQFGEFGVVVVTGKPSRDVVARASRLRFCTVLVKPVSRRQLTTAVEHVASSSVDGEQVQARAVAALRAIEAVLDRETRPSQEVAPSRFSGLTGREQQVVDAIVLHGSASAVATELGISPHTVKNHLKSIYRKLDVHSLPELLALARRPARRR